MTRGMQMAVLVAAMLATTAAFAQETDAGAFPPRPLREDRFSGDEPPLVDIRDTPRVFIDESGIRRMTPNEHDAYQDQRREREAQGQEIATQNEVWRQVRVEQAVSHVRAYAFGLLLIGALVACGCRSWPGRMTALLFFSGLAAVLYTLSISGV